MIPDFITSADRKNAFSPTPDSNTDWFTTTIAFLVGFVFGLLALGIVAKCDAGQKYKVIAYKDEGRC